MGQGEVMRRYFASYMEARLFGFIEEWLNGTEEIQTSGAKPFVMLRLFESLRAIE